MYIGDSTIPSFTVADDRLDAVLDRCVAEYRDRTPPWGFNGLGEIVYLRTYARYEIERATGATWSERVRALIRANEPLPPLRYDAQQLETWPETIRRVILGAQAIGAGFTKAEAMRLFDHMFHLRALPAGRMLWQLGTSFVQRNGANSLLNCAYVAVRSPEDFCYLFDNLMLGCGVGFSVQARHIYELPAVRANVRIEHHETTDADFIVPDSREGWTELLRRVLHAYFVTGQGFTYSTILIRPHGEPIAGFGGVASGPEPLIRGITNVCTILDRRAGTKLTSIDVLDIANALGEIVVAGNVRRSAEIALGDPADISFLYAKRWDLGTIPNWRAMSNNSVITPSLDELHPVFWEGYYGNGEPYGLVNIDLARSVGRLGEPMRDTAEGINPCGEIPLESYEFCNLAEIVLPNIRSESELRDCAYLLYKIQKAITQLPYIDPKSNEVVRRNARIGLSLTGVLQAREKWGWLDPTYRYLRALDAAYSAKRGWAESIRLTTIKPSGTLSLLAGVTPGVHPAFAHHYIRRVAMSALSPLVAYCRERGYPIEYRKQFDGSCDTSTVVVSFPCRVPTTTPTAAQFSAISQLETVRTMQTVWADNSVSVTVYYRDHELPDIQAWLRDHYTTSIKAVSFLRHVDHGFVQAPYEEIDEAMYEQLRSHIRDAQSVTNAALNDVDLADCESGVCPIR